MVAQFNERRMFVLENGQPRFPGRDSPAARGTSYAQRRSFVIGGHWLGQNDVGSLLETWVGICRRRRFSLRAIIQDASRDSADRFDRMPVAGRHYEKLVKSESQH